MKKRGRKAKGSLREKEGEEVEEVAPNSFGQKVLFNAFGIGVAGKGAN